MSNKDYKIKHLIKDFTDIPTISLAIIIIIGFKIDEFFKRVGNITLIKKDNKKGGSHN